MKKIAAIVIPLLLLGGAGAALYARNGNGGEEDAETYRETRVTRGDVRVDVATTGAVTPNLDVEIKCKASGEIIALHYDISDTVEKGDLLLKLDPVEEERNVRQAEVALASAEAKLTQAKQTLSVSEQSLVHSRVEAQADLKSAQASAKDLREKASRMEALLKKEYASPEEVESARASAVQAQASLDKAHVRLQELAVEEDRLELLRQDIALAEAEVESKAIALDTAKQRLIYTEVYAPISGVISDKLVQVGQIISSPTNNVSGGTALLVLSDVSRVFVLADVDESDIGKVAVGQPATVTVDAYPNMRFAGEVVRVATKGENISNVVTFEVKIEILDPEKSRLRAEMTADVDIHAEFAENVLMVPSDAVLGRGPRRFVLMPAASQDAEPTRANVTIGIEDGTNTEIVFGVVEGDTVLIRTNQPDASWMRQEGGFGPPPGGGFGPPPGGFGGGGGRRGGGGGPR